MNTPYPNDNYLIGPGSAYYQIQQALEIGQDLNRPIAVPPADHTFVHEPETGKYVVDTLDASQQNIEVEQLTALVNEIRRGGPSATLGIGRLQSELKGQLENGQGWEKEQK